MRRPARHDGGRCQAACDSSTQELFLLVPDVYHPELLWGGGRRELAEMSACLHCARIWAQQRIAGQFTQPGSRVVV